MFGSNLRNSLLLLTLIKLNIFRTLFVLVIRYAFVHFFSLIKGRIGFENRNFSCPFSKSFSEVDKKASITFEVSSEGEFEQILPLLDLYFSKGLLIELIFSSESVEKKVESLAMKYGEQFRALRLPLLSYSLFKSGPLKGQNISSWITSDTLVLCRYDFFPELLIHGMKKNISFILLSASFKNRDKLIQQKKGLLFNFWQTLYRTFDYVVAATDVDFDRFATLGVSREKMSSFDFRVLQINKRISNATNELSQKTFFNKYNSYIQKFPKNRRIILGSAWPIEMEIFSSDSLIGEIINKTIQITIAPHKLDSESIDLLCSEIKKYNSEVPIYHLRKNMLNDELLALFNQIEENPGIVLLTIPAILCECYSFFGQIFVGGGHGRSIHSVLEPYIGMGQVFCGPQTFRSTEFDMILDNSPLNIHVIENLSSFYSVMLQNVENEIDFQKRVDLINDFKEKFSLISSAIINQGERA